VIGQGTEQNQKPSKSPILIFKSRQAPLTFIRAWYSALPTEFRAVHRYTPPSLICGLVTFMWLTVVPSDMVYWLVRCPLSRGMGSSSSAQVTVGGGAPLAAHIRENCSPGLTTFSLKEEMMRGVPSGGHPGGRGSGSGSHRQQQSPADGRASSSLPPGVGAPAPPGEEPQSATRTRPCLHPCSREMLRGGEGARCLIQAVAQGSPGSGCPSLVQTSSGLHLRLLLRSGEGAPGERQCLGPGAGDGQADPYLGPSPPPPCCVPALLADGVHGPGCRVGAAWPQEPPPQQVSLPSGYAQSIPACPGDMAAQRGAEKSPRRPEEASSPSSVMMEKSCAVWDLRVAKHW